MKSLWQSVYPRAAEDNCKGVLIELFVSLVPITLIRFGVFSPHTMVAKALRDGEVQ